MGGGSARLVCILFSGESPSLFSLQHYPSSISEACPLSKLFISVLYSKSYQKLKKENGIIWTQVDFSFSVNNTNTAWMHFWDTSEELREYSKWSTACGTGKALIAALAYIQSWHLVLKLIHKMICYSTLVFWYLCIWDICFCVCVCVCRYVY